MNGMKAGWLCVLAVVAVAGANAASASAELPEVGRCLKVISGGKYKAGDCVTPATETEDHWEWYPPPVNARFEGVRAQASGFETLGGTKIYCTEQVIEGKWTGPRTARIELVRFFPCNLQLHPPTEGGPFCMEDGLGNVVDSHIRPAETVETVKPLEAELGFINKEGLTPTVGLELKSPPSPEPAMFTFFCGGPLSPEMRVPQAWIIEGDAIGEVTPVDKMAEGHEFAFEYQNGKQLVEHFEGGSKATLTATIEGAEGRRTEEVGMRMHVGASGEPLEVKAK